MLALAMYISCFLCRFHLRLVPNANPISGGIWALEIQDGIEAITVLCNHQTNINLIAMKLFSDNSRSQFASPGA